MLLSWLLPPNDVVRLVTPQCHPFNRTLITSMGQFSNIMKTWCCKDSTNSYSLLQGFATAKKDLLSFVFVVFCTLTNTHSHSLCCYHPFRRVLVVQTNAKHSSIFTFRNTIFILPLGNACIKSAVQIVRTC